MVQPTFGILASRNLDKLFNVTDLLGLHQLTLAVVL
jgi:hypothetical protein